MQVKLVSPVEVACSEAQFLTMQGLELIATGLIVNNGRKHTQIAHARVVPRFLDGLMVRVRLRRQQSREPTRGVNDMTERRVFLTSGMTALAASLFATRGAHAAPSAKTIVQRDAPAVTRKRVRNAKANAFRAARDDGDLGGRDMG